jgi:hypothetical protein
MLGAMNPIRILVVDDEPPKRSPADRAGQGAAGPARSLRQELSPRFRAHTNDDDADDR